MPQLYVIIPVGGGEYPDIGLPPGHGHPGNRPPGSWGGPVDPGWGNWAGGPHPGNRPPGSWGGPVDPGWGGGGHPHPGGGPIIPPVHVGGGPILNPELGTPVPPEELPLPIPPETISSQYIVSVYDPKTQTWTSKSFTPR